MAANEYEPSAEAVEALAKELHGVYLTERDAAPERHSLTRVSKKGLLAEARFVLRRQHEREEPLLKELRDQLATWRQEPPTRTKLERVLAAHAKLDAPKVPTLAECEKRLRDLWAKAQNNKIDGPLSEALDAWKAAVEREEKR